MYFTIQVAHILSVVEDVDTRQIWTLIYKDTWS